MSSLFGNPKERKVRAAQKTQTAHGRSPVPFCIQTIYYLSFRYCKPLKNKKQSLIAKRCGEGKWHRNYTFLHLFDIERKYNLEFYFYICSLVIKKVRDSGEILEKVMLFGRHFSRLADAKPLRRRSRGRNFGELFFSL